MKALVTGAGGLLGRAVAAQFANRGAEVSAFDHAALDITDTTGVVHAFENSSPEIVINCAAWTDVDGCESHRERAMNANAVGPGLLALACRRRDIPLITISTDYIFDGEKDGFYTQRDQPNPQSVYAVSKLEGERRAQMAWARTIIIRSGYIFGAGGTNFLSTLVERGRRGQSLKVIEDSFGTPTYAPDLANRLFELAQLDLPGIFHVVNDGDGASFAQFAHAAFADANLDADLLQNVPFASLQRPAPRPRNSRLRCLLSPRLGLSPLPYWRAALREFIAAPAVKAIA